MFTLHFHQAPQQVKALTVTGENRIANPELVFPPPTPGLLIEPDQ